jgi:type III pantothenate kinase
MVNILDLDLGNSRAKWRIEALNLSGNLPRASLGDPGSYPALWAGIKPDQIRLASVLNDSDTEVVIAALQQHFSCALGRAYSCAEAGGVFNGYADPARLGVDRWLALLAARQLVAGDVIVVDAGTALTLDLLTGQGQHLGGYILPGVSRQVESLFSGTGRVQLRASSLQPRFKAGRATEDAVAAAITAAIAGLFSCARQQLPSAHWCLTGGDVEWLKVICDEQCVQVTLRPDLVLEGLAWCPLHKYPAP